MPDPETTWQLLRNYTMVKHDRYLTNLHLALDVRNIPGGIVEAGVWRGGAIAGIAATLGPGRDYWLFDSFEGLPPAQRVDGAKAAIMTGKLKAEEHYAQQAMQLAGVNDYHLIKGWFADTLPTAVFPNGIALLRLDGDWYDSTLTCLEHLFPQLNPGGLLIVDDYYVWPGCRKALHHYLTRHDRPEPIQQAGPSHPPGRCVCYLQRIRAC